MQPGSVRAIEYEVMSRNRAVVVGLTVRHFNHELRSMPAELAVVRCVDDRGTRLTFVGDPRQFRKLLTSGRASDPEGVTLERESFPVVLTGWRQAGRGVDVPHPTTA
jgi:hypothetical protein